jgi:hypothetical protein
MLYRAVVSSTAHRHGHDSANTWGEYVVFVELAEEGAPHPAEVITARFANHFAVPPSSVCLYNLWSEEELVAQAIGPAHPAAWRWFESGSHNGQPSYIRAEQLLILVDDGRTAEMMLAAHTELMQHLADVAADLAYDDQMQQDLQMDGLWYGLTGDPEIDDAWRSASLPVRTHVRIGGSGRRMKPLAGSVITRVRQRLLRAEENRRVTQARMALPPAPLVGRNARTFRAHMAWELKRSQVVFAATFSLAMAGLAGRGAL